MRVYVINQRKEPLMPTTPRKARLLLKEGKARVVSTKPFTIQLLEATGESKQPITLGIDSGYLYIGFSATTAKKELISGEVHLLQGMKERLKKRADYRRLRRSRLRYRKPRFDNRKASKQKGWLAPSIKHKLDTHTRFIETMKQILPITKIVIEVANFDIQKIKHPDIEGVEYQQGEQSGFWNVREYVLHRDNHTCQNPNCTNTSKSTILEVHHIVYTDNGGTDAPSNLITLCSKCHTPANHKKGKFLYEWQRNKPKLNNFKDATFMTTIRWRLMNETGAECMYGYMTKNKRIAHGLEKSHANDAFIIAGGTTQEKVKPIQYIQVRRNNRSLEKFYDAKMIDIRSGEKVCGQDLFCGRRTRNKTHNSENLHQYRGKKIQKGRRRIRRQRYAYQPHDLVKFEGEVVKVIGTMNMGKSVKLTNKKNPSPEKLTPYKFCKGLSVV